MLLGGRDVDRRIERPGGSDHPEIAETLDDVARQRGSLAHDAHHLERPEPVDHGVRVSEVVVEHRDVGPGGDLRPVGHAQRDTLKVVEDRNFHC